MKKYRSRFLKVTAATWLAYPISYLLFSVLIFDIPATKVFVILLSPWFFILSALGILTGYGFHMMHHWAWYTFLMTSVATAYANALVLLNYSASHNKLLAFIFSIVLLVGLIYGVAREVRVPYFFPKIRWWESNPRYRLSIPAKLALEESANTFQGEILDISISGCFIKIPNPIPVDELIKVQFELFRHPIEFQGTVVWQASGAVTHPKGVGIKFAPMFKQQRRLMKAMNSRLDRIASLYQSGIYTSNPEEFQKQLQLLNSQNLVETASGSKSDAKKASSA